MAMLALCLLCLWASGEAARQLPQAVIDEIRGYQGVADRIRNYQLTGAGRNKPYERLQKLGDKFGHRFVGSDGLELAIDDLMVQMKTEFGVSNVQGENVTVKRWVRGEEDAFLTSPRHVRMAVMSLGHSVGTNGIYVEADVVVVKTFDELRAKTNVAGKIVVYNQEWKGYGDTVGYRVDGAVEAARKQAVASFVKSVTDFSLYTPHTGIQIYNDSVTKIPHGALTVEDVELMQRMQDAGETVKMKFRFNCKFDADRNSRNVLATKSGTTKADEVVLFGGHIDTWDVGTGSMDDGGGVAISWQVMTILKALNLKPARTMRSIFWTSEETDQRGAQKHFDNHQAEKEKMTLAMESDHGTFTPFGVGFTGTESARAVLQEVVKLLQPMNASQVGPTGNQADTAPWTAVNVPTANLFNANQDYFFYHHTQADTMTMMNSDDLDKCAVVWATVAYVVADLKEMLPRTETYPTVSNNTPATWRMAYNVQLICLLAIVVNKLYV